jgi:hypothetical protein
MDEIDQLKQILDNGVPEHVIVEALVNEGASPENAKRLMAKAKNKKTSVGYSHLYGQPSSQRYVQTVANPDPNIQRAHQEANTQMSKIAETYHHTENTISELQAMMFIAKYLGWSLMVGDGIFSYWALKVALNNEWMAIYLAVGICAAIFIMGVGISIKSVDEIFVLDKNDDGVITAGERLWFSVRIFVAVVCVGTDVLSNYMGMDVLLARSIVPIPLFPGWLVAMFLAVAIMLLPQVIVSWGDVNMRKLSRLKPLARIEAANVQGDTNWATGYQREVATRTTAIGQTEGGKKVTNWKIRS